MLGQTQGDNRLERMNLVYLGQLRRKRKKEDWHFIWYKLHIQPQAFERSPLQHMVGVQLVQTPSHSEVGHPRGLCLCTLQLQAIIHHLLPSCTGVMSVKAPDSRINYCLSAHPGARRLHQHYSWDTFYQIRFTIIGFRHCSQLQEDLSVTVVFR